MVYLNVPTTSVTAWECGQGRKGRPTHRADSIAELRILGTDPFCGVTGRA